MSKLVVLPAPITPMPAGATIDVAELMLLDGYQTLPLCLLRISTTNRKRFNLDALERLAANVKEVGILQPILIRPVKPTDEHPQAFEIVAGERRFRSAVLANLDQVPVIVRQLSDLQAAEIQLLENIQREDPHPLEEAEGYQMLMQNHGYDADQLAERVKKSRAYIYGRLKLCALATDVREVFLDGDISASTALLIARIPVPALQKRALKEILSPTTWPTHEPMSHRRARDYIQDTYTLDLTGAPFDIKDGKLLATAGNCTKCPKRTGNQPEVYPDAKSAHVCTDPDCYAEKKAAHYQRIIVVANKRGIPILEGQEATNISYNTWSSESEFVSAGTHLSSFERVAPATGMSGHIKELLPSDALPSPASYLKNSKGEVTPVFKRSDVQAVLERQGICETPAVREARLAEEAADPSKAPALSKQEEAQQARYKQQQKAEERAARITLERTVIYRKLRERAKSGLTLPMLRELAKLLVRDYNSYSLPDDILGDLYKFDRSDDDTCAYIDQADESEVQLLIMDMLLGEALSVSAHSLDDDPELTDEALLALAKIEGVSASTTEIAIERIDISDMKNPSDVQEVLAANIEHLADVARHIIDKAPHLTGNVEAAANRLGYFYNNGWSKAEDADGAAQVQADATAQQSSRQRPKLQAKAKLAAEAAPNGPVIKTKKNRSASLPSNPAVAWPFPTDSLQKI
ncbi:ParB/RepB/Spo0J family partition protein [Massilia sp. Root351]|uniref:ParB/RepB/Spo0J family partition protein n=1 Tax=Massilia sp. Root351 TaxID=1736522 RepID=UPI00138EEBC7|nr:ParB/RepB/Spo0J family partition protein [Massilia sp. Root351]